MTHQVWELLQFGYSLVQFGLKSYVRFQNGNGNRFEITSMISDQNCTTRGSITTLLHLF